MYFLRRLCILCLLSRIGGRGKESKNTRRLVCIYFTIFGLLQGTFITAVTEPHARVQRKALLALLSQTRQIHSVFWLFLSNVLCFVLYDTLIFTRSFGRK